MINVFKSVVAAAAVTACCMGNELPAKAHHAHGPSEDYAVGAIYGATCATILGFTTEQESAHFLLATLDKRQMSMDDITPAVTRKANMLYRRNRCQAFKSHVGQRVSAFTSL